MRRYAAALLIFGAVAAPPLCAQQFPTHPVRILVPLSAGGGMDAITRGIKGA
jgi:tripartite-type tricarboxylate transporter receptor subunit TctC